MSEENPPRKRQYRKAESFVGETFNRLTILRITGRNKKGRSIVECQCSCGSVHSTSLDTLISGEGGSCGCLKREMLSLPTHLRPSGGRKRGYKTPESKWKSQKAWIDANPESVAATAQRFRERHPEQIAAEKAAYYQKNKRRIVDATIKRFATDPRFRIEMLL